MEKLKEKVIASEPNKNKWRKDYNSEEWQNANQLNILLTGISLNRSSNCECIEDLFFILKRPTINNRLKIIMENKFRLKAGKLITSYKFETISEHSTDEELIAALSAEPAIESHFDRLPSDWKEICGLEGKKAKILEVTETDDTEEKTIPIEVENKVSDEPKQKVNRRKKA